MLHHGYQVELKQKICNEFVLIQMYMYKPFLNDLHLVNVYDIVEHTNIFSLRNLYKKSAEHQLRFRSWLIY